MTLTPQLADDLNTRALTLGKTILAGSSQYYERGFWHTDVESAWWLAMGPGPLAATMHRYAPTLNPAYRDLAIDTVERAMSYNLRPVVTGATANTTYRQFAAGYEGILDPSLDDTCNIEMIALIGWVMQMLIPINALDDDGDPDRTDRWLLVLKQCCTWLNNINGNTVYYINGNFAAHLCLAYWTVADLCRTLGDEDGYTRHITMYEAAYVTMVTPSVNGATWTGYGQKLDVTGGQWDWSDYTGYLTETPGYTGQNPSPTFDPYYSTFTLDILTRLYMMKRDHRIMRLINMIHNKMEPLINSTTWVINCTGGSRTNFNQGYVMAWLQMVPLLGLRAANRTFFTSANATGSWDTQTISSLTGNIATGLTAPGTQRQFNFCVASVLHAANAANKITL